MFFGGLIGCRGPDPQHPITETRFLMDTVVRIAVYDEGMTREDIRAAIERAFEVMRAVEAKTSMYVDSSEVSRIAKEAGRDYVRVSDEIFWLLNESVKVSEETRDAFDVTVGVVKRLWDFDSDHPSVPDSLRVKSCLAKVDYRGIRFRDGEVFLRESGMQIDLGGIAKGYVIDRGVEVLEEAGVRSGIVDAGGDLRIFGRHPWRETWRIGIRHPRKQEGELFGVLETGPGSIFTSGDYERYFVEYGKRYHHILDPKTGFPAEGCVSVTVAAESGVLADAYATAVFVMGPAEGMTLIERLPGVEGLIIYEEGDQLRYVVSEGLRRKIQVK